MNSVVVTAKTLDEAITNALLQLGASSDQVNIEVLEEGSKGFMGLFGKSFKVRATLKDGEEPVVEASEPISNVKVTDAAEEVAAKEEVVKEESAPMQPIEAVTVTGEKVVIDDTIEKRLREANSAREAKGGNREERRDRREGRRDDRRDRRRDDRRDRRENREERLENREEEAQAKPAFETPVYEIPADAEEVQAKVKAFLTELLGAMGIQVAIETRFSPEGIMEVSIDGEGMGVIIGKRGATLDSLQYLATLVVNKGRADHVRLKLDTEGYRARRQETLEKLAINLAKKVKRTGHRVVLEPMNPYERRIIHSVLQADRAVETHSDGEEPYRKVIISPKRRRNQR
ncbi:MAG: Jag N-terminal domain-containing protein [Firmicutes bacterium]|nr:Jag N-terminal domain-containing protein [Bacillota bacterium]